MSKQTDFTNQVYQAGIDAGLPAHIARLAASQAALESGYGKSVKGNNYFGIKAGKSWKGKTQSFTTHENYNGKRTQIVDKFRAYDDPADSLKDWAETISSKWPGVMKSKNFDEAVRALDNGVYGKYATDPDYKSKLSSIDRKYNTASRSPQTAVAALDQFSAPTPQGAPTRAAYSQERSAPTPTITPMPDPSIAYQTRESPAPRRDPRTETQEVPQVDYIQQAKDSIRAQLGDLQPNGNKEELDSFSSLFEAPDQPFNTEAGVFPMNADRPASMPNAAPDFEAIKAPVNPQASTFQNIKPTPKMDGIGQGVNFADFMAAMGPKTAAPPRRAVMGLAPVNLMPQQQISQPQYRQPVYQPPQINPNDHNAAALQAIQQGKGSYVNSSGSVMPTRAPNGNFRKTYGD